MSKSALQARMLARRPCCRAQAHEVPGSGCNGLALIVRQHIGAGLDGHDDGLPIGTIGLDAGRHGIGPRDQQTTDDRGVPIEGSLTQGGVVIGVGIGPRRQENRHHIHPIEGGSLT